MNTPTPWRIHDKTELTVVAQNNRTVANTGTYNSNIDSEKVHNENVANAELIVRAVNYHDRLVDMVDRLSKAYEVAMHRIDFIKNSGNHEVAAENARNDNMVVAVKQLLTEIKESK